MGLLINSTAWCRWSLDCHRSGDWDVTLHATASKDTLGLASDDVTKHSNAWQRKNLVLNKDSAPYKCMRGESPSLGEALYSFLERSERFWQLLHSLVRPISEDLGDRTSAEPFFDRSPISQNAFVWDAIFVYNQFWRLLRQLLRCDLALASPNVKILVQGMWLKHATTTSETVWCEFHQSRSWREKCDWKFLNKTSLGGVARTASHDIGAIYAIENWHFFNKLLKRFPERCWSRQEI